MSSEEALPVPTNVNLVQRETAPPVSQKWTRADMVGAFYFLCLAIVSLFAIVALAEAQRLSMEEVYLLQEFEHTQARDACRNVWAVVLGDLLAVFFVTIPTVKIPPGVVFLSAGIVIPIASGILSSFALEEQECKDWMTRHSAGLNSPLLSVMGFCYCGMYALMAIWGVVLIYYKMNEKDKKQRVTPASQTKPAPVMPRLTESLQRS